ncbi:MAG: hypothetical protein M9899_07720 [Bdellovibrionaceae bacterium]|nr:hypothetical protein [Pseudobdellovibrionaceae bacterium]
MNPNQNYDVLIFSIFGRNTWLAAQLRALGYTVAFLDLTSLFQKGTPEDWEGPFPQVFTDTMERSYCQSLTDQDEYEVLLRGPSIRIKKLGLFEFKADHSRYLVHKWGQEGLWFHETEEMPFLEPPKNLKYPSLWLKGLLKEWRSTTLNPMRESLYLNTPEFPLSSHYVVRHPSREGYLNNSAWLETVGVDIVPVSSWWKCAQESNKKWVLKFENDMVKAQADHLIIGLSSYELHRFSGQLDLGQNKMKVPKGFWTRWTGTCASTEKLAFVPSYSMYLSDLEMGLCNENLIIVIKRPNQQIDVWACITTEVFSEQSFVENTQNEILKNLKNFVPEFFDLKLDSPRLGSDLYSFWPVYDKTLPTLKGKRSLILDNPEVWPGLDNYSRYVFQKNIIQSFKDDIEVDKGVEL